MSIVEAALSKVKRKEYEWYKLRPVLGNANWALFYILLGGREAGKSFSCLDYFLWKFKTKGNPFYWMRLSEISAKNLLQNNACKLVDPDLVRRYDLHLETRGNIVYDVKETKTEYKKRDGSIGYKIKKERVKMCTVLAASQFYNDKGQGYFDNKWLDEHPGMEYLVALDEMNREKNEKNTFDITYAVVNQLENVVRSTKYRTKVFMIGNTLEEASDLMCCFNFIPEDFGTYYLVKHKKILVDLVTRATKGDKEAIKEMGDYYDKDPNFFGKRAVIEYIEPSEAYKARRKGTIADLLMPNASTFTNKIDVDKSLISKVRLIVPQCIIKFTKDKEDWFTLWNNSIIAPYNGERKTVVAMRPYLDEVFNTEIRDNFITMFDSRAFKYRTLICFKKFQKQMQLLKPRKQG